jgi:hypothetical protein
MRVWAVSGTIALLSSALAIATTQTALANHSAVATSSHHATSHVANKIGRPEFHTAMDVHSLSKRPLSKGGKQRLFARYAGGISCVPFARSASGIELKGNAVNWWDAASGVYARGSAPETGSVLNFRAIGRMRLGHVAVVTEVVNSREVEIDHANWSGGGVSRGIPVIDVSENNDWSEVRVGLGHGAGFGSVYPTYGFIYDRPDHGTMIANTAARPLSTNAGFDEVAEAPASSEQAQYIDAANHSIR